MKLIIDISEKTYKEIKMNGLYLCPAYYLDLEKALKEAKELKIAEPKKGYWIGIAYDGYADGYPVYDEWECSCCGVIEEGDEPTWNYCPNCGARMDLDEVEE